jgi:S1-C subfamily serine protease
VRSLFTLLIALALASCTASTPTGANASASVAPTAGNPAGIATGDFASAVKTVAQKVRPSVVQITNQQVQIDQLGRPLLLPAGTGTGVIYDAAGRIMTNAHVVAGAKALRISLVDGRSFPADLVGSDPQTDIAVVQVKTDGLPVAPLQRDGKVEVGDWVVAIGHALALPGGPTVTQGVVSALGRTVQEPAGSGGAGPFLFDLIQTDAPINPGNSGGPLVDLAGRVVGINTLTAGLTANGIPAQGIGFAVSLATAMPVADELVRTGKVAHAYIGVGYTPLTPGLAAQLGVKADHGAIVTVVAPGSPAANAGLKPGDVMTSIDGKQIQDESDLARVISQHKPGDKIKVTVLRGTAELTLDVTLGERPT